MAYQSRGVCEVASEKTGVHVTPTILRHTLGSQMKRAGADILDIKKQMRHQKIESTMRYVNMDKEALKKAVEMYVPEF